MLNAKDYLDFLIGRGINFYTGVPDSLLKDFCACIQENISDTHHIKAANEGGAVGLAIGAHLGTGTLPAVYLQNSGVGNLVNPLLSLASPKIYSIPMILFVGWRGKPGTKDEPQHEHQGEITTELFQSMGIPQFLLSSDLKKAKQQTNDAILKALTISAPIAILVTKGLFEAHTAPLKENKKVLSREDAIITVAQAIEKQACVISTTGMASRELYEFRMRNKLGHKNDFLTVGGMGHANQIALGIATSQRNRPVYCFDGDGAALMHLGSLAIIGQSEAQNFIHILLNNGAHASVGGQPTVGFDINFCQIAKACGYKHTNKVETKDGILDAIFNLKKNQGPHFIEIQTKIGNRKDLGRPKSTPLENKNGLMEFLVGNFK